MKSMRSFLLFSIIPLTLSGQWVQTNLNPGLGYCLFSNDTLIFAGTDNGVYYTDDAGDPWFGIGPDDLVFSIITTGGRIIAGSGAGQGIWLSSDLGKNWTHSTGMDNQSVNALCRNSSYIFAGVWAGGVFRSDDNGSSWQKVGLDGDAVESLISVNDTIFASGMGTTGARVYFTANNGDSWDHRELPYPTSRVHCFAEKNGQIFAGTDGGLYSSKDSGKSWVFEYGVTFDSTGGVSDVKMFRELLVYDKYLIGAIMFNSIRTSADNGKSWQSFNDGLISDWTFEGLAVKDSYLWSLRSMFGNAYRRPASDLVTNIRQNTGVIPNEYSLDQNYPNPFNPFTVISWRLARGSQVDLTVYNLLGEKIATLASGYFAAGTHTYRFDGSDLAGGVYLYQLTAVEFTQVKKMILLR